MVPRIYWQAPLPEASKHYNSNLNLQYLNEVEVETVTTVADILHYLNEVEVEPVTKVIENLQYLNEVEVETVTTVTEIPHYLKEVGVETVSAKYRVHDLICVSPEGLQTRHITSGSKMI